MQKEKNKKGKYLLKPVFVILFLIGLFACEKEDRQLSGEEVSPKFSAGIKTKASDTIWHENDSIGIMMFQSGTETILNDKFNCLYVTPDGDGLFTTEGSHTIIFPGDGSAVDFLSYYPYVEEQESFIFDINVADQTNLPAIDFMTSDRFEGASKNSPNVLLRFHHRLTKLVFNFKLEDKTSDASVKSFFISGMFTQGIYDMLAGEFEYDDRSEEELEIPIDHESKDYPTATGIVLPREAGAGIVFRIILDDGREYEVALVDDLDLETETMYIFNITLRDKETPPSISAAIIEEWKDTDGIKLETNPLIVAAEPGVTTNFIKNDKITLYDENGELSTFTYDGTKTWTPEAPVYWENIGDGNSEKTTLRASYIRQEKLSENQMPELFLAEIEEAVRYENVHFNFSPVVSKVIFQLVSKSDVEDEKFTQEELKKAVITLPKYLTEYTFANGVLTPGDPSVSGNRGDIEVPGDQEEVIAVAFILPQKMHGKLAIIKMGNKEYSLTVDEDDAIDFKKGEATKLIVNITKTEVPSFSASYKEWNDPIEIEGLTALIFTEGGTTTNFVKDDKMDLYYLDNTTTVKPVATFTYEGSNNWSSNPIVYWETLDHMEKYDFYAVSTLKEAPAGSNQMNDIMYAEVKESPLYAPITLAFTKQTTKVIVELESKDGSFSTDELKTAQVYLPGYKTGAYFNKNQYVAGTTPKDVQLSQTTGEAKWNGLIQEQTIASTADLIKISIGNNDYYIKNTEVPYEKNKAYTFKVDIKKTGTSFTASYSGWTDAGDNPIEIPTELE